MTPRVEQAIAALWSRDVGAYRRARDGYYDAKEEYRQAAAKIASKGLADYAALSRAISRHLRPHRVEWRPHPADGGADVDHAHWTSGAHLAGVVYPKGAPRMAAPNGADGGAVRMGAEIKFRLSPRSGDEFARALRAIKAAADALAGGA
jgi:hypothetical protein